MNFLSSTVFVSLLFSFVFILSISLADIFSQAIRTDDFTVLD